MVTAGSFSFASVLAKIFNRTKIPGRKTLGRHSAVPFERLDKIIDVLIPDPFGNFPYRRPLTDKQVTRLFDTARIDIGKRRHSRHLLEKTAEILG